jgi:hypothetical protein
MAAVTIDSGYPKVNVNGSEREYYYLFDIAEDGDTLTVPMRTIRNITYSNDTDTSGVATASTAISGRGTIITLDTAGAVTNVYCRVTGH